MVLSTINQIKSNLYVSIVVKVCKKWKLQQQQKQNKIVVKVNHIGDAVVSMPGSSAVDPEFESRSC